MRHRVALLIALALAGPVASQECLNLWDNVDTEISAKLANCGALSSQSNINYKISGGVATPASFVALAADAVYNFDKDQALQVTKDKWREGLKNTATESYTPRVLGEARQSPHAGLSQISSDLSKTLSDLQFQLVSQQGALAVKQDQAATTYKNNANMQTVLGNEITNIMASISSTESDIAKTQSRISTGTAVTSACECIDTSSGVNSTTFTLTALHHSGASCHNFEAVLTCDGTGGSVKFSNTFYYNHVARPYGFLQKSVDAAQATIKSNDDLIAAHNQELSTWLASQDDFNPEGKAALLIVEAAYLKFKQAATYYKDNASPFANKLSSTAAQTVQDEVTMQELKTDFDVELSEYQKIYKDFQDRFESSTDLCPNDAAKRYPLQCGCGYPDIDTDGDGKMDCMDLDPADRPDKCPSDPNKTESGICGCGVSDEDSDNDGFVLCRDLCPNDPNKNVEKGFCPCGAPETDTDKDGYPDCVDVCHLDPNKNISKGICDCGNADTDTDGDNIPDCNDKCPQDPNKSSAEGVCGCGVSDKDSDGDLTPDCHDECPQDKNKVKKLVCGCGVSEIDTDGDSVLDCNDECPTDENKTKKLVCGCHVPDVDLNQDGTLDCKQLPTSSPTAFPSFSPTAYEDIFAPGYAVEIRRTDLGILGFFENLQISYDEKTKKEDANVSVYGIIQSKNDPAPTIDEVLALKDNVGANNQIYKVIKELQKDSVFLLQNMQDTDIANGIVRLSEAYSYENHRTYLVVVDGRGNKPTTICTVGGEGETITCGGNN